jgi:hypothetical protein
MVGITMTGKLQKKSDAVLDLFADSIENQLTEVTVRLRADQVFGLELIENARLQRGENSCDTESLIREAIDVLIEKNIIAVKLPIER